MSSQLYAESYESCSCRSVHAAKGTTPTPSDHPSRTTPDDEFEMNVDVITEEQDHWTAKRRVCRFYHSNHGSLQLKCQISQALKRDGYRCMLSGKFDLEFYVNLKKKYNRADYERRRISRAAHAASNAPAESERNSLAADLVKEADKLQKAANRHATALGAFPTNAEVSPTNAVHIFPESINVNHDVEKKVSNGYIYALTRYLYSLRRSLLREYGLQWTDSDTKMSSTATKSTNYPIFLHWMPLSTGVLIG